MALHSIRHWISFFFGMLIFVFGLFPMIGKDAWLFNLSHHASAVILAYIVAFGGLYIIVDSFFEFTFHSGVGIFTLLIGLIIFSMGLIVVLHSMAVIPFSIPFLDKANIIYQILFVLEGLFLMVAAFIMD